MYLSEIAGSVSFPRPHGDTYVIESQAKDHLVLHIGHLLGNSLVKLTHPNILAQHPRVFEFKRYLPNGGKRWTSHAGVERFVAVPLDRFLLDETNSKLSYIYTSIAGERVVLSVSGGGGSTWTDWLTVDASTMVNMPRKTVRAILDAAWSPDEARARGVVLSKFDHGERDHHTFAGLCSERAAIPALVPGCTVVFTHNVTVAQREVGTCTLTEVNRRRKTLVCDDGRVQFRARFAHVDWVKTCAANAWSPAIPETFNRLEVPAASAA
jgi:hypothetical protein